jgi:hypothetical protein
MENKQITIEQYESYCNLELLQKLYNKGFRFKLSTEGNRVTNNLAEQRFNEGDVSYCDNYITYSVLIEWLRVNHGIWIYTYSVAPYISEDEDYPKIVWVSKIQKFKEFDIFVNTDNELAINHFNTPQEAYSAAFDYVLNNLI